MFAVICSSRFYKEIEQAIITTGDQVLFKTIDSEIDINTELIKVARIGVKHLIIDITSIDQTKIVQAIRKYRIMNEETQVIIIAPNFKPGNEIMSLLVSMGVYDIISPEGEDLDQISILDELIDVIEKPTPYSRAVKWDIGVITETKVEKEEKIEYRYKEVVESVFKKVIAVFSPTSEGASSIAAHLAHAIAGNKNCKVLIIDLNPLKPVQREIFDIKTDYTIKDALDSVVKRTLSNVVLESFSKESKYNKNLFLLPGLYDLNDFYNTNDAEYFEEIIEKAKFSYDYVILDTHSWHDVVTTDRALYMADDVIVAVRGRENSLDTVNRYLEMFEKYNDFDIRRFKLVINKYSGDDLTFVEIESKTKYPVIGYISEFKDYDRKNGFKNKKLMNEYIPVLNALNIRAKKKKTLSESLFRKKLKNKDDLK